MATKDPRVDAYIARAAPFAQPILKHIRKVRPRLDRAGQVAQLRSPEPRPS
jgi:hypothetical protein